MSRKGYVRSIPVTEPKENMQVIHKGKVTHIRKDGWAKLYTSDDVNNAHNCLAKIDKYLPELSQLVIEYLYAPDGVVDENSLKQLPLKYSQWQKCLDNNEIDKEVEFDFKQVDTDEVLDSGIPGRFPVMYVPFTFAKIIPQQEKLYTKQQMELAFKAGEIYGDPIRGKDARTFESFIENI